MKHIEVFFYGTPVSLFADIQTDFNVFQMNDAFDDQTKPERDLWDVGLWNVAQWARGKSVTGRKLYCFEAPANFISVGINGEANSEVRLASSKLMFDVCKGARL